MPSEPTAQPAASREASHLHKHGDGVVGLDNFNFYYDPSLKKARKSLLASHSIFVVEGDINDGRLLAKLFDVVPFTHVMHLAAQAGVRYAIQNPASYIHSNIAGLVMLLEACKAVDPQPAIVWASSSSVYGLNEKVPISETHRTDRPASLYAATKKAGEKITHTYNHIYGLSIVSVPCLRSRCHIGAHPAPCCRGTGQPAAIDPNSRRPPWLPPSPPHPGRSLLAAQIPTVPPPHHRSPDHRPRPRPRHW